MQMPRVAAFKMPRLAPASRRPLDGQRRHDAAWFADTKAAMIQRRLYFARFQPLRRYDAAVSPLMNAAPCNISA